MNSNSNDQTISIPDHLARIERLACVEMVSTATTEGQQARLYGYGTEILAHARAIARLADEAEARSRGVLTRDMISQGRRWQATAERLRGHLPDDVSERPEHTPEAVGSPETREKGPRIDSEAPERTNRHQETLEP